MAIKVRPLEHDDREGVLEFLHREPLYNLVMMSNIVEVGFEKGAGLFGGDYAGVWNGNNLIGAACAYELGSFIAYVEDRIALVPLALYYEGLGVKPRVMLGRELEVDYLSHRLMAQDSMVRNCELDLMRLTSSGLTSVPGPPARPAQAEDLDQALDLSRRMEIELLGKPITPVRHEREMAVIRIREGVAYVCEMDGKIVSKAEATVVLRSGWREGAGFFSGAQLGGVYTDPDYRGKGYSTSCIGALCGCLLETVEVVVLWVEKDNRYAQKVYRKVGFVPVGDFLMAVVGDPSPIKSADKS